MPWNWALPPVHRVILIDVCEQNLTARRADMSDLLLTRAENG